MSAVSWATRLDDGMRLRLAREGGVARVPALVRPREVTLGECSAEQRRRIATLLDEAEVLHCSPAQAGRGDQRYFHVLIRRADDSEEASLVVPEACAPRQLTVLWQQGPAAL
ncbi:protealysin inhibitor emfourin [Kushneria aurantia]|uniref:Protealysin inhibitor emfourin n=1 Tax=Kushneria aurantia TaxID=504092 RepID=A0ABV6G8L5_9GAMM|nr:protealysin inhibitor emfourin [Kushneria aurantia]